MLMAFTIPEPDADPGKYIRPRSDARPQAKVARTLATKPGVLVVDDEPAIRALLRAALERSGFAVWVAVDGHEAIQVCEKVGPQISLALLDVRMPGLDGPATLRALQNLNPDLACCFMTGDAGKYTESELARYGAARIFAKPFALADLRAFLWMLAARVHGGAAS
jgi:CheY-like chemotaxis protein